MEGLSEQVRRLVSSLDCTNAFTAWGKPRRDASNKDSIYKGQDISILGCQNIRVHPFHI